MSSHKIALEQDVVVTQLKGNIYLVAADGSQKQLAEGDILPRDAVLITPEGASFNGGNQTFTLSPTNEQQAEDETSQAPLLAQNQDVAAGTPDEISALQQAILGGADPTQAFEAAAAGGAPAAGGGNIGGVAGASGNGGFVTIDRTGDATIAEATFDTTYNANGEPPRDAVGEDEPLFTSVNLVLSADAQVSEGGFIIFTATLNEPVFGSDLVIQLSNGAVITIPVGQSSGSVTVAAPADSPYVDPSTLIVSITGTQGGGFNQIITGTSTTTQINDTIDTTTVTLSSATAGQDVVEGGSIVYTASVNNPVTGSPLSVTLSNGVVITIPVGASSANSEPVPVRGDDAYQQGEQDLSVTIGSTSGGNYEAVTTAGTISNTVVDDSDVTTVTLSSATAGQDVVEGGSIVYTASVNNP
ncbi:retention module-containing protein, partial [Aeromonas salmonicida]